MFRILALVILVNFTSCDYSVRDQSEDLHQLLNDPENGYSRQVIVDDIIFNMKFIPPELQAFKESTTIEDYKNLLEYYSQSYTFVLSIDSRYEEANILLRGVETEEEYNNRIINLEYNISSLIKFNIAGQEYEPVLSHLERGLPGDEAKHLILVYEKDAMIDGKKGFAQITYNDQIFNTGISHFSFDYLKINQPIAFNPSFSK